MSCLDYNCAHHIVHTILIQFPSRRIQPLQTLDFNWPVFVRVLPSGVHNAGDLIACVEGAQAIVLMTEWDDIVRAD